MSTKEKVLQYLEQHKGESISGQDLADKLEVSRTSVWKAVNGLKKEGYQIEATTNKGYQLSIDTDLLSEAAIVPLLSEALKGHRVIAHKTIDSTNLEAKRIVNEDPTFEGVILSEEQTKGRGRLGRVFYSPSESGLYMSLVLRPVADLDNATLITTAAAVAVCQAIETLTGKKPQIKWVNDIFLDGRKVCGILTEGIMDMESRTIGTIILGIGLNFREPETDFPDEIQSIAGTLFDKKNAAVTRNQMVAEILNRFYLLYPDLVKRSYLDEYRKRCFVLGEQVTFPQGNETIEAKAIAIDNDGGLVVALPNGKTKILTFGEISIKIKKERRKII
ncbi:transcriptional repressor c-terminal [Trichococcus flocculiformis]|uniref:Bifunctional ligase/repressor BirA n=1 Tax=Trichococcus flocculiformis TaxID=82803 RepID=A0AB38BKD6_9LACT|nr:biotin--[acetyl-CoA-carboxylase] ligase [Trichococcus flocculiformis]CZQ85869.1 transcriptional repressor c-terminal [Trichococcus flocculiformis]SFI06814.1 BirA family transcriptional regulator, biotin operon repressor / biotin-[acetyl-CoA-carboxylase] ligase [Trichococcus flocculiformis]